MTEGHELEVLFPDRKVTVRDPDSGVAVTLTAREFRFREGLEATALARPLIAALAGLVSDHAEDEGPDALAVEGALAANAALWLELAARACGRDAAWLARLSDADGRALSEAMWAANGGFFCAAWRRRWQRERRWGRRARATPSRARHPRPRRTRARPPRPQRAPDVAADRSLLSRGDGMNAQRPGDIDCASPLLTPTLSSPRGRRGGIGGAACVPPPPVRGEGDRGRWEFFATTSDRHDWGTTHAR